MKKLKFLAAFLLFFNSSFVFAQTDPGASHIWEKAASGKIPGIQHVLIRGWNPAITTTFEDASPESSLISIPTAALSSPYCASTSANDNALGTGARTLELTLVDTSFVESTEIVILAGQSSVNLTTVNVLGFNGARVITTGSGLMNAGVIDCGTGINTAGSAAVAYVTIGVSSTSAIPAAGVGALNNAEIFQYIVPAGKKLICRNIQVGSVFATQASGIMAVIDGSTNLGLLYRLWGQFTAQANMPTNFPEILVIPEKTYFKGKLAGATGTNTGPASMSMECLRVDMAWEATNQGLF